MGWAARTFASVVGVQRGRSPRFLDEPGTAFVALVAARVVLTAADEAQRVARVREITAVCVTVAHATTSDRHVLDAVVVLNTHTHGYNSLPSLNYPYITTTPCHSLL